MKLSGAITRYVEMKRTLGVSFRMGAGWLCAFSRKIDDVSIGSVTKWQVLGFLDGQRTSNVTWLVKYRVLKAFFEYWMMRNEVSELPMPRPRAVTSTRVFTPCIYSAYEL